MTKIVHLISDSTGETIAKIGEAALALFPNDMAHTHLHVFVRSAAESEEHTSELQSRSDLVCRLLLEKKKSI